ncbi:Putative amidase [Septoria linicola]|uniref:Amidase n=1 Tax=Septoria linicola TaxID=215465 RepID=A0A9Q9EM96_9PEZI|nr:Putative amidase [Septoria linicola]
MAGIHASNIELQGTSLTLNGTPYYVPPEAVGRVEAGASYTLEGTVLGAVTIITADANVLLAKNIEDRIASYLAEDDVYQEAFSNLFYVQHNGSEKVSEVHRSIAGRTMVVIQNSSAVLPDGPYFTSATGNIHQAYRLYRDVQGAFTEATVGDMKGSHSILPATLGGQAVTVAVPSRLYYTKTALHPLAGVRLGVKDIFDVAGLKTSNGNRAWEGLYPAPDSTASSVQRLLDAGAVLVGKMKTSQFAIGETATADWVDYHAPFNPRGDGYQDPSSSSAGPAAGVAAYEWLDIDLGTDTGGSIRSPSQVNGVFGNRPSHGLVSLDGVMPIAPELDTIGLLARDPSVWSSAAQVLYGSNISAPQAFPSSILTIGFPAMANSSFSATTIGFLAKLKDFLSASQKEFNMTEAWSAARPDLPPLAAYFQDAYDVITSRRQAELVRDPFYADYAAAHDGRLPFVNPSALVRWAVAENITSSIEDAMARKKMFQEWIDEDVLPPDAASCSRHLLVYVPRTPTPKYRNTYLAGPTAPQAFSTSRISVFAEVPDMAIPIGEVEYVSNITGRMETLPVAIDFVARKGCDEMLFGLVDELFKVGIVQRTQAGSSVLSSYKR